MSERQECVCGHNKSAHGEVSGRCLVVRPTPCRCDHFVHKVSATAALLAEVPANETRNEFGVPSAFAHQQSQADATAAAVTFAIVELRMLIAAVDDVLSEPAPQMAPVVPADSPLHMSRLASMVRHRASVERLAVSQGNARRCLERMDRLRGPTTAPPAPAPATEPAPPAALIDDLAGFGGAPPSESPE